MNQARKLLAAILANPKAVRFTDACKAAELIGFTHKGGQGSHRAFARPDEPELLNFQNRGGSIAPYQARQLIRMIERYGEEADKLPD
ncbi:MAG: type II toxin-antitoxin system HicA family toxin [Sterolibacteriaceae bacterium MAG5]|nr:type II toxin-antitoxin system HicA family toxin [Candidatus Nitricoxidireducens bremensis]